MLTAAEGWQALSTRAVALIDRVTVFVEFRDPARDQLVIDAVEMQAYPCLPEQEPEDPDDCPTSTICVSFADLTQTGPLGSTLNFSGFIISKASGTNLTTVTFGAPAGARKLLIPDSDIPDRLIVTLPDEASRVVAIVSGPPSRGPRCRRRRDRSPVVQASPAGGPPGRRARG